MEFRILGPLEVEDAAGNALRLPTGRERALFVCLLLRRGEVVSTDTLIDALWGGQAPATAAKAVQGYVSHLRRLLGPEGSEVLLTRAPGYVLKVDEAHVDAARFERLANEARRMLEDGDPEHALRALEEALALWRGSALAEFAFEDFAQRETQRLEERRLEAREDRFEALLQLGRHGGLISELEALVSAHPLRERLRGQLMIALYRAGRPADALDVYRDGARASRELGLDPAAELKALERAILDQDPELAGPARTTPAGPRPARGLPAGTVTLLSSDIVGSTELLRKVGAAHWGEMLARHRAIMRGAFAAHGGSEVDTQGDAFFAAFARAGDAVAAAVEVQREHLREAWPEGAEVRVRVGLHTGAPTPGEERYVGLDVHRVARVAAAAHGGEILCTASTATLADSEERGHATFVPLGEFTLEDFPRPERLVRVVADGLPSSFPPPTVPGVRAHSRRGVLVAAGLGLAALVVLVAVALDRVMGGDGAVAVVPPAVAVIDPETNRVVASLEVGPRPVSLTTGNGSVWVGDGRDSTVSRIDPSTQTITQRIGIGASAVDLAAGLGSVWIATGGSGEIVRIDPAVDAVAARFSLGSPAGLVVPSATAVGAGKEGIWVGALDGLVRLDPRTGRVVREVDLGAQPALSVALGDGAVWATAYANRVNRIDASTGQVTAEFYAGAFVSPVAVAGTAVWAAGEGGQAWKLDPVTAAQLASADVTPGIEWPHRAEGLAIAGEDVWVTSVADGRIVRIDGRTGVIEATLHVDGSPFEALYAGGLVWVTVLEAEAQP